MKQLLRGTNGQLLPYESPLGMTGLTSVEFPYVALGFLSTCVYPLVLLDVAPGPSNTIVIYVPDRALTHSQWTGTPSVHQEVVWKIHHVFDDEWTFDGARGAKQRADPRVLNPIRNDEFIQWFVSVISERMSEVCAISDVYEREQLTMTVNRAMIDAQLCIVTELPYLSKVLFFSCLDKLANLKTAGGTTGNEESTWNEQFDGSNLAAVRERLQQVPTDIGEYIRWLTSHAADIIASERLNPQDFRAIRNSLHGYYLRRSQFPDLAKTSGTFNNDITLVTTPLVLDALNSSWIVGD